MNVRGFQINIGKRFGAIILILMVSINVSDFKVFSATTPVYLYVSQAGNDIYGGTIEQPFKTIERARDVIRSMISGGMNSDIIVYLRGGTYYSSSTLVFDSRDSGRNGYTITYKNYGQENVVLSGAQPSSGWQVYSGNIYSLNVGTSSTVSRLYEGDTKGTLARYPNTGYNKAVAVIDTNTNLPSKTKFAFKAGDIPTLTQTTNLQVYIWSGGTSGTAAWSTDTINVTSIDYVNHTITLASATDYEIGTGSRYIIQKSLALLDSPGELYLNQSAGILYYWPQQLPIQQNNILVPRSGDVVQFKGLSQTNPVSNISMEGVTISYTDIGYNGVLLSMATVITLKNCVIENAGGNGISFSVLAQNNTIYGNHIYNIGENGVKIESPNSFTVVNVKNNIVSNNYIHDTSLVVGEGCGITLYQSDGNTISYNRIRKTKGMSICMSAVPEHFAIGTYSGGVLITEANVDSIRHCRYNVIENNDVSEANLDRQDTGLIYSWGTVNNTIRNNKMHDSYIQFDHGYGLYLDDESDDFTISNNLIYNLQINQPPEVTGSLYAPLYIKGRRNVANNNIVADNNASKGAISSFQMGVFLNNNLQITSNILYNNGRNAYAFTSWGEDRFAVANKNLFYDVSGQYNISGCPLATTWTGWKTILNKKYDQNSVTADPQFMDAVAHDYRLNYNSPAYALGVKDINFEDMGLKQDYTYSDNTEDLAEIFIKKSTALVDSSKINVLLSNTTQLKVSGRTTTGFKIDLTDAVVAYTSDNESIATVDNTGLISANGKGIAKITATVNRNGIVKSKDIYIDVISDSAVSWYFCNLFGNQIQQPQNSKYVIMSVSIDKILDNGLPVVLRCELSDQSGLIVRTMETTQSFGEENSIDMRIGADLPDLLKKYYLKIYYGDVGNGNGMVLLNTVSVN